MRVKKDFIRSNIENVNTYSEIFKPTRRVKENTGVVIDMTKEKIDLN